MTHRARRLPRVHFCKYSRNFMIIVCCCCRNCVHRPVVKLPIVATHDECLSTYVCSFIDNCNLSAVYSLYVPLYPHLKADNQRQSIRPFVLCLYTYSCFIMAGRWHCSSLLLSVPNSFILNLFFFCSTDGGSFYKRKKERKKGKKEEAE